jgi:hypothetical protein
MGAKIHLYPLERFIFGDDDYYDIDYFDGLVYQTAKIKGSVIKSGILSTAQTIYSSDGTLSGERIINADNHALQFDNLRKLIFNVSPDPVGTFGVEFNIEDTGQYMIVRNATTAQEIFRINGGGVRINDEYYLPTSDGLSGQVISTDGAGNLSFISLPTGGDMFKSQYDPNNDGIVESARKEMVGFINKTGSTLLKGTIVYLKTSSVSTTFPEALKANASTEATSSKTIGAVFEDVLNDQTGYIVTSGEVDNLDTSAYSIGQRLWLSTTDGLVTTTPPTQPNHSVFIGIVTRSQNINGRILYAIQNGYELGELHDVLLSGIPNDEEVLTFNGTTLVWENKPIPQSENIYNTDGSLTGNRVVDGNNFGIEFQNLDFYQINVSNTGAVVLNDLVAYYINPTTLLISDRLFSITDTNASLRRFAVLKSGEIQFNQAYKFPLTDGTNGQVLTTNGSGAISWITPPSASGSEKFIGDFYTAQMSNAANYTWNGVAGVSAPTPAILSERWRFLTMPGVGGATGVYMQSVLPSYYITNTNINIKANVTTNGTGGSGKIFIGICRLNNLFSPRRFGSSAQDTWGFNLLTPTLSYEQIIINSTFTISGLLPNEPISIMIFRNPADAQDTFTGDIFLNSCHIEIV